jgi:P4 family phage/plasmid primase-like protien
MGMDYNANIFPEQTYECIVDMRAVEYIKENFNELNLGSFYDEKRPTGKKIIDCKAEPQLIMNFLNSFKPIKGTKQGKCVNTYRQNKGNPRRMTSDKMSIQGISRCIRHSLCRDLHYDIDIENCHPVLLTNWCKKQGVVCSRLDEFNSDRKNKFMEVRALMKWTKDETKTYLLRLINGGGITGLVNETIILQLSELEWFLPLIDELQTIRDHVGRIYPNLMEMTIKAKGKDYYNKGGTCLSYLLTNLENQVLNIMTKACILRKVKIAGIIYDGFQAYKSDIPDIDEFMRHLESEILLFSGYSLRVTQKIMDEGLIIPDDWCTPKERKEQEEKEQKENSKQQKEQERQQKEQERQRKEQEEKEQKEQERQQKEQERQRKEQEEKEQKEQERQRKEQEKQEKQEQKEQEKQRKEQEKQEEKKRKEEENKLLKEEKARQKELRKEQKKDEEEETDDVPLAKEYLKKRDGEILYDKKMGYGYFYRPDTRLWCQFKSFDCLNDDMMEELGLLKTKDIKNIGFAVKQKLMNREDDLTRFNMRQGFIATGQKDIIDLKTLTVREREKEDLCSFYLSQEYRKEYDKKWVNDYIGQLLNTNKQEYIDQVLEVIGYIFTGENNLKIIIIMMGKGDNGKSLFIEVVKSIMEQYSTVANIKIFKKPKFENNTHEAYLYPLIGKRAAFSSELAEEDEFNATVLKNASGNDSISIRNSGAEITFDTILKSVLVAITNSVPKTNDVALWNRLKFINFANTFEKSGQKEIEIKSHKNDLFCAFLEGAKRYYDRGMKIEYCDEIVSFTKKQKDAKDSVIAFCGVYEIEVSDNNKVYCKELYQAYIEFCRSEFIKADGKETFYQKFERMYNFIKDKDYKGNYYLMKNLF